jgi:hypothetical protein
VSASNKLGINQSSGSILLGKDAGIAARLPCFWRIDFVGEGRGHRHETAVLLAEEETIPSATTLDVVEIAPHASSSNKLGINQSNGSRLLGKMRSSSQMTIEGHGEKSVKHGHGCSLRQTCDKKSMYHERGRSLRETHEKKLIYIKHARGRSLRMFTEKFTIRIL